ncbi:hypothetical protein ID866_5888 [Astraeus odoratus]|nr:hypothetical protein ID866_5888 [Astraeus odoratus]
MIFTSPVHFCSLIFEFFSNAPAVISLLSSWRVYYAYLDWKNSEDLLRTRRLTDTAPTQNLIYKQLTFTIVTFQLGKRMMKHSLVSCLLFAIVVIRFLTIQVKLARMARSLQQLHGPLFVTVCVVCSALLLYLKLAIEVALAAYYLVVVFKNPSLKDMVTLALGVLRLVELR